MYAHNKGGDFMRLTLQQLQDYCDMLPIAYYAGESIPLIASSSSKSSANVVNKTISISLPQINDAIKDLDKVDINIVRSLAYHEASHIILSPTNLLSLAYGGVTSSEAYRQMLRRTKYEDTFTSAELVNIVEDERIESINRNVFMEVDFEQNVKDVCNWHQYDVPTSVKQAFFSMIRMHYVNVAGLAKPFDWQKHYLASRQLIAKWQNLRPNASREQSTEYCKDIGDLFAAFYDDAEPAITATNNRNDNIINAVEMPIIISIDTVRGCDWGENKAPKKADKKELDKKEPDEPDEEDELEEDALDDEPEEKPKKKKDDKDDKEEPDWLIKPERPDVLEQDVIQKDLGDQELKEKADEDDDDKSDNMSPISLDDLDEDDDKYRAYLAPAVDLAHNAMDINRLRKEFAMTVLNAQDENVKQLLEQKFFIKDMHGQQMGAIHKHAGKLDVKSVGRKDWKIFKQPSMFSDGSKIGKKMHLIIVLDQSGSYAHNDKATNLILSSLTKAEEKIKAFEFTLLKFGTGFHVCKKNERYSYSTEGTEFSVGLFKQIDKLKRQDCANFIIFLNDGSACGVSDWQSAWNEGTRDIKNALKHALDHDNCVCILDSDAASWFKGIKNAKLIVTDDYVRQLSKNVCEALSAMLAV